MIKYKDLKKNDQITTSQLGPPITGKQSRVPEAGTRPEAYHPGLDQRDRNWDDSADEGGSVYANQVIPSFCRDGIWQQVTGQPA